MIKYLFAVTLMLIASACASPKIPNITETKPVVEETAKPAIEEPEKVIVEEESKPTPPPQEEKKKAKIALLLPLSGQHSNIGKAMFNASELAFFDISAKNIILMPFDTKGTEEGAKIAAKKAIEAGSSIILGPVFRYTTRAVMPVIKNSEINLVSFSNDKSLLEQDNIFLLSFNPAEQIERVVDYAHSEAIDRFSALVPDNTYGITTINELTKTLEERNLPFEKIEWYLTTDENLSKSIKRVTRLNAGETDEPEKSVGLLVPEGGRVLLSIASRLYRKGISGKRFRLLGSGEWDDETIAKEPKLEGGWFATSPPKPREVFENNFRNLFNYKPIRIASLAYDGIALAAYLANGERFDRKALTDKRGFVGVNGIFRFNKNGMAERALAVIEITKDGLVVIDPAPESF